MHLKWMLLAGVRNAEGVVAGGGTPDAGGGAAAAGSDPGAAAAAGGGGEGFKVAVDGTVPDGGAAAGGEGEGAKPEGEARSDEGVKDGEGEKKDGEKQPEEFAHKPEDYKFTLADGAEADPAQAEEFAKFAVDNKIPPEQAQALVDFYAKTLQEKIIKPWVDQVNAWGEATKTDKEYGGAAYEENVAIANRALAEFGTPELGAAAREHGWGNHPEFVRFMYRVGKAMGVATTEKDGGNGNPGTAIPAAKALYG